MSLLKNSPNLIGIMAGDVQYSDFSDRALSEIAQQYCADNSILEIILEIDRLIPELSEQWREFSVETNVSFESCSEVKSWLLNFRSILQAISAGSMGN